MSPVIKAAVTASLAVAVSVSAAMGILSLTGALSHRYFVISIIAIVLCIAAGWAAAPTGATRDGALAGAVVGAISSLIHLTVSLSGKADPVAWDDLPLVAGGLALWASGGALLGVLGVALRRRRLSLAIPPAQASPWHAVLAVVLLLLSSALRALDAMGTYGPRSVEVMAAATVPLFLLGVVLGVASLVRRGEPRPGRTARVSFWTMVVVFFLTLSPSFNRVVAKETARKALQVDSTTIRHQDFRFALPHPGPGFRVDSAQGAAMERRLTDRMLVWVLAHDSLPDVLVLTVVDSLVRTEEKFRDFTRGMTNGIRKRGITPLEDTVTWQSSLGEARLVFIAPEGYLAQMRCITSPASERIMRLVCVQTLSPEGDTLGFVRAGLRAESPPSGQRSGSQ